MARDTSRRPSGSSQTEGGTTPKARFRDDGLDTSDEAGLPDASLDTEIAALGDMLLRYIPAAGTIQGFPDRRETNPIDPQDETSARWNSQVATLSDAIRYIRFLEGRV